MARRGFKGFHSGEEQPQPDTGPKGDLGDPLDAIMGRDPDREVPRFDEQGRRVFSLRGRK